MYKPGHNPNPTPENISVSISDTSETMSVGDIYQLTATVIPAEPAKTVSWYTYDSSVATVDAGLVRAVGVGTATIRAYYEDTVSGNVYFADCDITVNDIPATLPDIKVTVSDTSITKYVGETHQLTATVTPAEPVKTVSWYTYNSSVATVNATGLVKAVGAGTTKIRAYYEDTVMNKVYFADTTITVIMRVSQYIPVIDKQTQNLNNLLDNINNTSGKEFTFKAENSGSGSPARVVLPMEAIDKMQSKGIESIKIVTDTATLLIKPDAFDKKDISSVTVEVKKANAELTSAQQRIVGDRPVYDFKILTKKSDGSEGTISSFAKPVEVVIPYILAAGEDPRKVTVFFIDENGKLENRGGTYDAATGTITFKTNHFSKYFAQHNNISFKDLGNVAWAQEQIGVMTAKGIINGTGEGNFSPDSNITRGDFLLLLVKTLGLSATVDSNFSDVKPTDYYYEAIGVAKKLGLTKGTGSNTFEAEKEISRQDMMVLVAKAMKVAGKLQNTGVPSDLEVFKDKNSVAEYAAADVATLVKAGLVKGSGSNIEPNGSTTRAEAAVLLYRIYSK